MGVVKHRNRLPRDVVETLPIELSKTQLGSWL